MTGDRIEVRGLRLVGLHGLLPEERSRSQPFEIDLDLEVDMDPAVASDTLGDTSDYGAVIGVAAAVLAAPPRCSSHWPAPSPPPCWPTPGSAGPRWGWELRPPVPYDVDTIGVRVTRPRLPGDPVRVFLGLGSNMGDREEHLRRAVAAVPDLVGCRRSTRRAGGRPDEQGDYPNVVAELATEMTPRAAGGAPIWKAARRVRTVTTNPGPWTWTSCPPAISSSTTPGWWCPTPGCGKGGSWSSPWPIGPRARPTVGECRLWWRCPPPGYTAGVLIRSPDLTGTLGEGLERRKVFR